MKKIFFNVLTLSAITITACNNNGSNNEQESRNVSKDTAIQAPATDDNELKTIAVTYTSVDAKTAASFKEIVDHYLQIKNALANDNGSDAASGAKAMGSVIMKLDKSLFTAEQKKVYDGIEEDLVEHAEHIGKNGDNIEHQREHFSMMSEDVYDLAKAFGSGRVLYHVFCPMYNDGKGAMWLSELREIRNPYFGDKMINCGTIEEMFK